MKNRTRFTQEQRSALLEGYATSNLSARQYAGLNCVGFSTLAKWAGEEGISLRRKKKNLPVDFQEGGNSLKGNQQNSRTADEVFSFIDMTGHAKGVPFESRVSSSQAHEHSGHSSPLSPCGMEIRLPTGITIRINQVSTPEFWPQVMEFVRVFA